MADERFVLEFQVASGRLAPLIDEIAKEYLRRQRTPLAGRSAVMSSTTRLDLIFSAPASSTSR
jgi:hypothetical protein